MINKNIILNYLKDNNYNLDNNYKGIDISINNNELLIKGTKIDLIELADYILSTALSDNKDHIHIDDLSLINKNSKIKNLIIEKE